MSGFVCHLCGWSEDVEGDTFAESAVAAQEHLSSELHRLGYELRLAWRKEHM